MSKVLPKELAFIDQYRVDSYSLEHAFWLTSPFPANTWTCKFGDIVRVIDFCKELDDGSSLTDTRNSQLLNNIKRFLCLQTHPLLSGTVVLNPTTAATRVSQALHVIDYFLLRSEQFEISKRDFRLITANDIIGLIATLTTSSRIKESIYEPALRMLHHLSSVKVSRDEIEDARVAAPGLLEAEDTPGSDFSHEQTIAARAWLKLNGCYVSGGAAKISEFRHRVIRMRLLHHLIGHRTLGSLKFDGIKLPGFDIEPVRRLERELPAVPVSNFEEDDRAAEEYVGAYVSVLNSMRVASLHGFELIPKAALIGIEETLLLVQEGTKTKARFTTLPFEVANELLSKAIAFYLEHGEPLVNYYLSLARDGNHPALLTVEVPTKLRELGISQWRSDSPDAEVFFTQLRSGKNLQNMLEVLWGSIAVMVNTLMARRVGELEDITASSIVEEHGAFFLAFDRRKANVREHRARTLRPLPAIAAEALKLLAKVSKTLKALGYETGGRLFEAPYSAWNSSAPFYGTCLPDLSRFFDRFCDYHQTSPDELGRRYYVRAHQLRRNFALLFFWKGSFGGIEVLRYFLGHLTHAMTYRYITEGMSGKVLRRVKASVAKDLIRRGHDATATLSQLLCTRYGLSVTDLYILPERDVVDYIEDLLVSGEAEIEPEFFNGPNGEEYRVLYKIKPTQGEDFE